MALSLRSLSHQVSSMEQIAVKRMKIVQMLSVQKTQHALHGMASASKTVSDTLVEGECVQRRSLQQSAQILLHVLQDPILRVPVFILSLIPPFTFPLSSPLILPSRSSVKKLQTVQTILSAIQKMVAIPTMQHV